MDLQNMLKQAQKLQKDMEDAQNRLETEEEKVSIDGCECSITGSTELKSLKISEDLYKKGAAAIEKAALNALKEAISKSKKKHEEAMKKITSGLELPDLGNLGNLGDMGGIPGGMSDGPTGRAKRLTV